MTFQYQKTKKIVEVLNDLVLIQNERIAGYHLALESTAKEPHFNDAIKNVINNGLQFKYSLIHKMNQIEGSAEHVTTLPGKLYQVWKDLKIKFPNSTRRSVVANCQYNEMIALHVSNAAMNDKDVAPEIRKLIEEQETVLNQHMTLIQKCNNSCQFGHPGLMYFN